MAVGRERENPRSERSEPAALKVQLGEVGTKKHAGSEYADYQKTNGRALNKLQSMGTDTKDLGPVRFAEQYSVKDPMSRNKSEDSRAHVRAIVIGALSGYPRGNPSEE